MSELRAGIAGYIEIFYNRQSRHSSIGYLTPNEFEEVFENQLTNA
jgi:transposase InsO family protein